MRPITVGTIELCRDLGLKFVDRFEALAELDESEAQRQVFTFLFIHGYRESSGSTGPSDIQEMLRAVRLPVDEFRRDWLIPFALQIPMGEVMSAVFEWLTRTNLQSIASMFDVLQKLAPGAETAPPNS